MDMDTRATVKLLLPKVPKVGKAAISHTLGISKTSSKWDLKTALIVNLLRSLFDVGNPEMSVSKLQRLTLKDPGIRGRMWVSKATIPTPPEVGIREALFKAIESLKETGSPAGGYMEPELRPVEGEWTGYRARVSKKAPEPSISEEQKYAELMKEVSEPTTILYFHGGAHFMMDPCTHRKVTVKLAKLTKGRVFAVRYRLAPQNPFPSGLLDAFISYFHLLYPPPNSIHTAVDPKHIVFAGDSAGGNLCFALLQLLLELRRQNLKVLWNGSEREVPVPAGIAGNSPWLDITQSSTSCEDGRFDYIPSRKAGTATDYSQFPPDAIWPSKPARNNMYAEDSMLCHPLVSPIAAKNWEGSPPCQFIIGEECLSSESLFVAMKMAQTGIPVLLDQYEAMPHCFAMVIEGSAIAKRCFEKWAGFMSAVVRGETVQTKGTWVVAKTGREKEMDVLRASGDTEEVVLERMRMVVEWSNKKVPETLTNPRL